MTAPAPGSGPDSGAGTGTTPAPQSGPPSPLSGVSRASAAAAAAGGTPTGGDTPPDNGEPTISDGDSTQRIATLEADVEKWRNLARKHEDRARGNAQAATQAKTLEQQIADLQSAMAERDTRDADRNARLAMSEVRTRIAAAGVKPDDVTDLLELVDPARLMTAEGEPDDKAIAKVAASITRTGGRPQPDPDQGQKGGAGRPSMDAMIRRAAGVHTS